MELTVRPGRPLRGEASVPGDKSVAHRALIAAALAEGESCITGLDPLDDALRTLEALQACGVTCAWTAPRELRVQGRGLRGLRAPAEPLNCGLSGTTMRLLSGVLAGQPIAATLDGLPPLRRRPMARITEPLRRMGARIEGPSEGRYAPFTIYGGRLQPINYVLPVASAQVKSALLFAALNAEGETTLREPAPSRDHTERLLRALGAPVQVSAGGVLRASRAAGWRGQAFALPGDISSAAFLLTAALLVPGSQVRVRNCGVNPTRRAVLDVLSAMGASLSLLDERILDDGAEPVADLLIAPAALRGVEIAGAQIPNLIDEIPILAVAATQAQGVTAVRDAGELRVKETDRIAALASELSRLGARIEPTPDGLILEGPSPLHGARVDAHGDHRMAMALAVAGLVASGETVISGAECIAKSYPGFVDALRQLGADVTLM